MNDDSLSDINPVNCPHGVAMDIYCEKCEMYNPPLTAEKLLTIRKNMPKPESVGTTPNKLEDASKRISVYEKEIWNAAIEAAAVCIEAQFIVPAAIEVRKLKK